MSQANAAIEFIFNMKSFVNLDPEGIMFFVGKSVAEDEALPVLLTVEEMTHLELKWTPWVRQRCSQFKIVSDLSPDIVS